MMDRYVVAGSLIAAAVLCGCAQEITTGSVARSWSEPTITVMPLEPSVALKPAIATDAQEPSKPITVAAIPAPQPTPQPAPVKAGAAKENAERARLKAKLDECVRYRAAMNENDGSAMQSFEEKLKMDRICTDVEAKYQPNS